MIAGFFYIFIKKYLYHKLDFPKLKRVRNQEMAKEIGL